MNFHQESFKKLSHNSTLWPYELNIGPQGRGKFLIDKNKRNDELEKRFW